MIKKLLAIIMLVMVASLSIAGCTSSPNSNQAASSASKTASTTGHTATSAASAKPLPPHLRVLFFYEANCPYCQALEPNVTKLQKTYAGKVPVQSIENYASPLASQYKVSSVPTLILLNNGHEVGRWVGITNTTRISAQIKSVLRAG